MPRPASGIAAALTPMENPNATILQGVPRKPQLQQSCCKITVRVSLRSQRHQPRQAHQHRRRLQVPHRPMKVLVVFQQARKQGQELVEQSEASW